MIMWTKLFSHIFTLKLPTSLEITWRKITPCLPWAVSSINHLYARFQNICKQFRPLIKAPICNWMPPKYLIPGTSKMELIINSHPPSLHYICLWAHLIMKNRNYSRLINLKKKYQEAQLLQGIIVMGFGFLL